MMKQLLKGGLVAATVAIACGMNASSVEAVQYNGSGGPIPDFDFFGGTTGVFTDTIVVPDNFEIADAGLTFDLNHSWVGDLIVTLDNGSTTVTLFDRVGRTGGSGFGDSSNLINGGYSFNDASGGDLWTTAASGDTSFDIPVGSYLPSGFENGPSSLSAFDGQFSAGNWTLTVTDNAAGDTGTITSWTLDLQPVPFEFEASLGLLAIGGMFGGYAFNKKRKANKKLVA